MADRGGPPVRSLGWLEAGREKHVAGRLGVIGTPESRRALLIGGLQRIPGIEVLAAGEDVTLVWIRVRDAARRDEVARALAAESLTVISRDDGAIGIPCDAWFRRADVTAVVLCVTKVAHHLALT